MRFLLLLLLVLMFPVHVLAGSHGHVPTEQHAPSVLLVQDMADGSEQLPELADDTQRFVGQGDFEEAPPPVIATAYQMRRAAFIRPKTPSFAFYVVPVDVFRPPRTV